MRLQHNGGIQRNGKRMIIAVKGMRLQHNGGIQRQRKTNDYSSQRNAVATQRIKSLPQRCGDYSINQPNSTSKVKGMRLQHNAYNTTSQLFGIIAVKGMRLQHNECVYLARCSGIIAVKGMRLQHNRIGITIDDVNNYSSQRNAVATQPQLTPMQ